MKICPKCNRKYEEDDNFCEDCSVPLQYKDEGTLSNDLASLGYDGIKQCPCCKTYFPAKKMTCPGCNMTCGESTMDYTLYEQAAKYGDAKAANFLEKKKMCDEYEEAESLLKEEDYRYYPRVFELLKHLVDKGDEKSYLLLAKCYDEGKGCEKDVRKAVYWYEKAVKSIGSSTAMVRLGEKYLLGDDCVIKDEYKAFRLFENAAERYDVAGLYWLGYCYFYGKACDENKELAYQCFKRSAENYYDEAAYALAYCDENGWGTDKNPEKAYEFYESEADCGVPRGLYEAGRCLYEGIGVRKDKELGLSMIRQASESGECYEAVEFLNKYQGSSSEENHGEAARILGKSSAGFAAGAAIGSIVPGVGTILGGVIGGAIGLFKGCKDEGE